MTQVTNNFLDNNEFHFICKTFTHEHFPWYLSHKVYENDGQTHLIHNLVKNVNGERKTSFFVSVLSPILKKLEIKNIIRAKVNLTFKTDKIIESAPHIDVEKISLDEPSTTAILYLNTNDGYTQIVGGDRVFSVENRLLTFPTNTSHFGTTHTNTEQRMVLNVVYTT
jgi:hypothetical protein